MVHDPVTDVKTVHPEHAVVTRMGCGESRFAWQGMHHRAGGHLQEPLQFVPRVSQQDTIPGNDHRTFSLTQVGDDVIERRVYGATSRRTMTRLVPTRASVGKALGGTSACCASLVKSISTGPGRPCVAIRNAALTTAGISSMRFK